MWQSYCAIRHLGMKENNFLLTIFPSPFSFSPHPHPSNLLLSFSFLSPRLFNGLRKDQLHSVL